MAQKTIAMLAPREDVDTECDFPVDDGTQTWKVSAQQLKDFVLQEILSSVETGFFTGEIRMYPLSAAPTGWLLMNGGTIGNASSGGTARANADTESLFTLLWNGLDNTACPVSGGRGASAAVDFAANKTLTLGNMTGLVPRMPGTQAVNSRNKVGPTIGLPQEDEFQGHKIGDTSTGRVFADWNSSATNGSTVWTVRDQGNSRLGPITDGSNGTPRTGAETKASAFGVNFIIKL